MGERARARREFVKGGRGLCSRRKECLFEMGERWGSVWGRHGGGTAV